MKKSKSSSFSQTEQMIIDIIKENGPLTVKEVCKKFYKKEKKFDGNNIVAGRIRRIAEKCILYDLTWTILGSGGGRKGKTVWYSESRL